MTKDEESANPKGSSFSSEPSSFFGAVVGLEDEDPPSETEDEEGEVLVGSLAVPVEFGSSPSL